MGTSNEIWAKRVKAWRASGKSSPEFCKGKDFSAGALRHYASRLKGEGTKGERGARSRAKGAARKKTGVGTQAEVSLGAVPMARVIGSSVGAPPVAAVGSSIVFDFAGVHVAVQPDFDRAAMRDLLALFGESGDVVANRRSR